MDEKKLEIIKGATEIYMKLGIKSVTMDEMARQLGVSKKTLYQYVSDKNDLVEQCIQFGHELDEQMIQSIADNADNAIDEILTLSTHVGQELKKVHPSIFFDLERYHPSAMNMIKCHKNEYIKNSILNNLTRGIKEGFYRENMNVEVIATMYIKIVDHVLAGEIQQRLNLPNETIYEEVFRYHIRGIASEKGIEYLKQKLNGKSE